MMKFNDLGKQWEEIRKPALLKIDQMGRDGDYIGGKEVKTFENNFSNFSNSKYSVGISNGTDALKIAFQLFDLGPNDLVIIPANTFIADYLALVSVPFIGVLPPSIILVDHDEYFNISIEDLEKFLSINRARYKKVVVVAVHLYGHLCNLEQIQSIKEKYDLLILEDCSQSHGSRGKNIQQGDVGDISVYSLYPGKNLGALGDAGILTTNSDVFYERAQRLRNYGSIIKYHHEDVGHNHRLDTLQAIVLNLKLEKLSKWNDKKQTVAKRYLSEIKNHRIKLPKTAEWCSYHSYHIFCLETNLGIRDNFVEHLGKNGIPTLIHYPIPIHKSKVFSGKIYNTSLTDITSDCIVSIPIHPYLTNSEVDLIIKTINNWIPL